MTWHGDVHRWGWMTQPVEMQRSDMALRLKCWCQWPLSHGWPGQILPLTDLWGLTRCFKPCQMLEKVNRVVNFRRFLKTREIPAFEGRCIGVPSTTLSPSDHWNDSQDSKGALLTVYYREIIQDKISTGTWGKPWGYQAQASVPVEPRKTAAQQWCVTAHAQCCQPRKLAQAWLSRVFIQGQSWKPFLWHLHDWPWLFKL